MKSITPNELFHCLKIEKQQLIAFLKENDLHDILKKRYIDLSDIHNILESYKNTYTFENETWPLPEWLLSNGNIAYKTLENMYSNPVAFPASLPPSQGRILHDLIIANKPINVIEIGCFLGISSIWIGSALQHLEAGHVYAIDIFNRKLPALPWHVGYLESPLDFARENVERAGLNDYITFFKELSWRFAKSKNSILQDGIDFLFIDGDHSVQGCVDDFISFYPYVKEGGTILLHDINPRHCGWDGPRYLIDMISNYPSFFAIELIDTEPNFGMALITKTKKTDEGEPWKTLRMEVLQYYNRIKTAFGYSQFYQNDIRPLLLQLKI